jgi:hypothetical protein
MQSQGGQSGTDERDFLVAAFGIDGELEGTARFPFAKLSGKWLKICEEFLAAHGPVFEAGWSGNLAHIHTRLTSSSGAALVTFSANGKPAASIALASGLSATAELSVLEMFIHSLRRVEAVAAAATADDPFRDILHIKERPVMIVVPWPVAETSDQDHALVRELSTHLAGAFFSRNR